MSTPSRCPECQRAPRDGCSHIHCPSRKYWGEPVPPASAREPMANPGTFKVRAKKGQP